MGNYHILRRTGGPTAEGQTLALCGRYANFLKAHLPHLLKVGLALCIGVISRLPGKAQCSGSLATHTYDTSLTSNGFGIYPINIPQWSPDSGLLVSVKLSAQVSSQYGYTLRNAAGLPASYALTLGQWDQFTSPALPTPYSNIMSRYIDSFALTPGQSVSNGPFAFLDNHVSSDSITSNVAPFLGPGKVPLSYMSFTFTDLNSYDNATYYYSASIANTMRFSVSYLYCRDIAPLAVKLTSWSVQLSAPRVADLQWTAVNETAGRSYTIQRSSDNHNFTTIHMVAAVDGQSADYDYSDNLPDSGAGNWYYRLQIHDNGGDSWSSVKEVSTGAGVAASEFVVYPNPASTYINVNTGGAVGDWQADILAADGRLVQRERFQQTALLNIVFKSRLAAGEYFIRLTDRKGQQSQTRSFVVVH